VTLTPVPMARIFLVTLGGDLPRATEVLGRAGVVQLVAVADLGAWAGGLAWPEAEALAAQYDGLRRRIGALMRALALPGTPATGPVQVAPCQVAALAEPRLAQLEGEVGEIAERERALGEEAGQLNTAAQQLQLLARLHVNLERLRHLEYLHFTAALVPEENLERLRGSLAGMPHALLPVARHGEQQLVLAFTTRGLAAPLERALQSAYAQRADLPRDLSGTPAEALRRVQAREAELLQERAGLEQARGALAARWRAELERIAWQVEVNAAAVDAWRRLGQTEHTRLVAGWLPADALPRLQGVLAEALGGRFALSVAPAPPATPGEAPASPQPPTQLRNPAPIRPLEALVTTYGEPNYHELDPTLPAGLLFVLMFGVMFGDVGQGAVLAVAGWLLTREVGLRGNRTFGWILLATGVSATIFGFLYGTVFLTEGLVPALWFQPLSNPTYFIQVAVIFGIAVISLALALNMANALRAGDRVRFVADRRGLIGLWFFWGAAYAAYSVISGRPLGAGPLLLLIGLPLILMAFLEPVLGFVRGAGWSGALAIVQSLVETFDTAVRYVSNTVSFIRLAAFAIAHEGIGIMIFILAGLVPVVAGAAIIVVGNAFVIGLEGLVVFIQALRLDYYEFFSKFFRADGTPFRPFRLPG